MTAAFDTEYGDMLGLPSLPAMLAMLTMRPQPRSRMLGTNTWQVKHATSKWPVIMPSSAFLRSEGIRRQELLTMVMYTLPADLIKNPVFVPYRPRVWGAYAE